MLPFKRWLPVCILTVGLCAPLRAEIVLVKAQEFLTLRDRPDKNGKSVQRLQRFEPVRIKGRQGDWTRVESTTRKTGWVLSTYLTPTAFVSVSAAQLKAVGSDKLNVRRGPGTNFDVIMLVAANYPFYVLDRDPTSGWLKVMDFDGDRGWVSPKFVSLTPYVITQLPNSNVRSGRGTNNPLVFTAEHGVLLRVLKHQDGWLNVRHEDGDVGWMSCKIVFGWLDGETEHAGFPKGTWEEIPEPR